MATVVEGSKRARSAIGVPLKTTNTPEKESEAQTRLFNSIDASLVTLGLRRIPPAENGTLFSKSESKSSTDSPHHEGDGLASEAQEQLTERTYLGLITLGNLLQKDVADRLVSIAFLLHMVLVGEMGLSNRRLESASPKKQPHVDSFLASFSLEAYKIVRSPRWAQNMEVSTVTCDVVDIIDGRLLVAILGSLKTVYSTVVSVPRLALRFSRLTQSLGALGCGQFDSSVKALPNDGTETSVKPSKIASSLSLPSILPFSSPIFDKHLASINISVAGSRAPRPESARIFQEVTHWHNAKRQLDAKASKELSGREKLRALRRNQFFMAEMLSYAASLTNAAGKSLEPETVTVGEPKKATPKMMEASKENDIKAKNNKSPGSKPGSNRKNVGKQAMLSNIAANKAAKEEDLIGKTFKAWETARKSLDCETVSDSKFLKAKNYLNSLANDKRNVVGAEVEFYMICVLLGIYKDLSKSLDKNSHQQDEHLFGVASMLWDSIRRLSSSGGLTKVIIDSAKQISSSMGLPPVEFPAVDLGRQLSFNSMASMSNLPKLTLASSPKDFQLLYCGPYMDRNLDSAPDSRVPFEPDGWQRKVLDELDADKSIFVVAPTSAGKTFISFYAMERILRADNDGVLVYVAPTKALVNQIAAEIQVKIIVTPSFAGRTLT